MKNRGWHVRSYSKYGGYGSLLGDKVWTYKTFFDHLLKPNIDLEFPEMIFHYPIPISYVEAIVCWSDQLKDFVINNIKNTELANIPVYHRKEFAKTPIKKYLSMPIKDKRYSDEDTNLCYSSIGEFLYKKPGTLSLIEIYNTLLNSGIGPKEATKLLDLETSELVRIITARTLKSIMKKSYHEPVIHPPYISSS